MTHASTLSPTSVERKPRDDEIDVHGVSHPGKVRTDNQDHFLICSLRKQVQIRCTSLPDTEHLLADHGLGLGPELLGLGKPGREPDGTRAQHDRAVTRARAIRLN